MTSEASTLFANVLPIGARDGTETVEESGRVAIEVVPVWCGTVMGVTHVEPGRSCDGYVIGEDPASRFHVTAEALAGSDRWSLVMPDGTVRVPPGADEVVLVRRDGSRSSGPGVEPMTGLGLGDRLGIRLGTVTFVIRAVEAPGRLRLPVAVDWNTLGFAAASLVVNLAILAAAFFFPPDTRVLVHDAGRGQDRWARLLEQSCVVDVGELPEWMRDPRSPEAEGGDGQRHEGREGQMGDPAASRTDGMYGIRGDADPSERRLGRIQRSDVKDTGILSALRDTLDVPSSQWGTESRGSDLESYLGALVGATFGPNFGPGGFGMKGTGNGGDGDGSDTIGLGPGVWTKIGHGSWGDPDGVGICPPGKICMGKLKAKPASTVPPKVEIKGEGHVVGCIGKDAIRRVIRQNLNKVRHCYEKGLAVRPDLEGRVNVGFVIKADGSVGSASVKDSSLGSAQVEECIAGVVSRLVFPAPEGCGVVIVSYPFTLVPAGKD